MIRTTGVRAYNYVKTKEHLRQPLTYTFIGGISGLLDLFFLFILVDLIQIWYLAAAAVSFILVSIFAFYFHKNFTFRHKGKNNKLRYLIFLAVAGSGLIWSLILLFILVDVLGLWYLSAAVIVKFIVLAWNFSVNKFITFRILNSSYRMDKI